MNDDRRWVFRNIGSDTFRVLGVLVGLEFAWMQKYTYAHYCESHAQNILIAFCGATVRFCYSWWSPVSVVCFSLTADRLLLTRVFTHPAIKKKMWRSEKIIKKQIFTQYTYFAEHIWKLFRTMLCLCRRRTQRTTAMLQI